MSISSNCGSFNHNRVSLENLMRSIFLMRVTIKHYINSIHMGKAKPVWSWLAAVRWFSNLASPAFTRSVADEGQEITSSVMLRQQRFV